MDRWLQSRLLIVAALIGLFAVGAELRLDNAGPVTARSPDEYWYSLYAGRIVQNGLAELPVLVQEYIRNPARNIYPPPWRIGYLLPLAAYEKLSGSTAMSAGAELSLAISLATLALVTLFCAVYLPPQASLYAMLALAVLIPDLAIARRTWPDALIGGLGCVTAWAAWRISVDHTRWWNYVLLFLAGGYSCLVKESGLFTVGSCAAFVIAYLGRRKAWRALGGFALAGLLAGLIYLGGLILAAGGLGALRAAWQVQKLGILSSAYNHEYQTGPWYGLIRGFWILEPSNLILGALAVGFAVLSDGWHKRLGLPYNSPQRSLLRLLVCLTAGLVSMELALPAMQNFRYLSPLHAPICLLSGLALWAILDWAGRRLRRPVSLALTVAASAVLVGAAISDYRSFQRVYVIVELPDLAVKSVLIGGR